MRYQPPQLMSSYRVGEQHHRIELIVHRGARLLVDRADGGGRIGVIAELEHGEGERQVRGLLHGDGAYLQRASRGERGLCRALDDTAPGQAAA